MTKKGEEEAEIIGKHPPNWNSGRYDRGNADK